MMGTLAIVAIVSLGSERTAAAIRCAFERVGL